jgi:hypothetical protein
MTAGRQCRNGGMCLEHRDGWGCYCREGFWGAQCENYDNPCLTNPCQNGGRCKVITQTSGVALDDRYWARDCDCKYPYYGVNCESKADLWSTCMGDNPCKNGGTCLRNGYQTAYTGNGGGGFWHLDYTNSFAASFAQNFRIQDPVWSCRCAKGFYGADCTLTSNPDVVTCPASNPCLNGGTCFVGKTDLGVTKKFYQCACPCGYGGHLCQIAAVKSNFNGFVGIGERMQFCSNGVACLNGGTCRDNQEGTDFDCYCPTGYYGNYCELKGKSAAASVVPSVLVVAVAAIVAALKF